MTTRRQRTADNLCVIAVISWFRPANEWIPFRMLFAFGTSILGDSASDNMVFTQGLRHTFALWQRALALVQSLVVQTSFASFRAVS